MDTLPQLLQMYYEIQYLLKLFMGFFDVAIHVGQVGRLSSKLEAKCL